MPQTGQAELLYAVRETIKRRLETDRLLPGWLAVAPTVLILLGFLILAAEPEEPGPVILGLALLLAGAAMGLWLFYQLIDRRNEHMKRVNMLLQYLADYAEARGLPNAALLRMKAREIASDYVERSPVLWILLSILTLGIAAFYVYHFLNKDLARHSRQEKVFLEELLNSLESAGADTAMLRLRLREYTLVPERSTAVYLILTLLTAGLFEIYWIYTLIKDPNEHFKSHELLEETLLETLEAA